MKCASLAMALLWLANAAVAGDERPANRRPALTPRPALPTDQSTVPVGDRADLSAAEAAIRENAAAYVAAYNGRDAKTLAALWSPEDCSSP